MVVQSAEIWEGQEQEMIEQEEHQAEEAGAEIRWDAVTFFEDVAHGQRDF